MPREAVRPATPLSQTILLIVLVFGAIQLYFWTNRSMWIDEVSQLLNFPLDSLAQAFGPLPIAQQASPPLFNLLLHAMSGHAIDTMRILMVALVLGVFLAALLGAFGRRLLPIAAGLFVLLSHEPFLLNATMLKFYALDIAGFAVFAAWIYAKDRDTAFSSRDVATLLAGMLMGASTIVGACVVVAVFFAMRLARKKLGAGEIVRGGLLVVMAFGYYLQMKHATKIQLTGFPDAYGSHGVDAVLELLKAAFELFHKTGSAILLVLLAVGLAALVALAGAARSRLAGLLLFSAAILIVFMGLAAIGKYPAVSSRHLAWMLGIFGVLAAAVIDSLLLALSETDTRRPLAIGSLILVTCVLVGSGLRVVAKWPPRIVEGASDHLVATLASLPPSKVLQYFGSDRLIPLMLKRGAPIAHHSYAPALSTRSGAIDPSYFGAQWKDMDEEIFSKKIEDMLRNDPLGWAKMYILVRMRGDFRPLARFVLDAAPTDGGTFYISAIHVSWTNQWELPTLGLRQALEERSCQFKPLAIYDTLNSPGFILEASCPER